MFERILVKAVGGDRVRAHDLDRKIRATGPHLGTALGVIGGAYALWSVLFTQPSVAGFSATDADVRTSVSSFGTRCVRLWAESSSSMPKDLRPCWDKAPYLPLTPSVVVHANVSSLAGPEETHQDGVWSVVVDTVVPASFAQAYCRPEQANCQQDQGNSQPEQAQKQASLQSPEEFLRQTTDIYFQLTVTRSPDGSLSASGAPMPIAPPKTHRSRLIAARNEVRTDSALGEKVNAFLGALLVTGKGLDWHVTSDSGIRAIAPSPFSSLTINQILTADDLPTGSNMPPEGTSTSLVVTAQVGDGAGQTRGITCPITAKVIAGRWLIASIDLAPQLSGAAEDDGQVGFTATPTTQSAPPSTSSTN